MKKTITCLAAAFTLLIGAVSCTNDIDDGTSKGYGKLDIILGFPATEAAQSDKVVPITTWNNNIKDVMLLLVSGNTISKAYPLTDMTGTGNAAILKTINDIPAGTYTAYILANYNNTTTTMYGAGRITPSFTMNAASLVGQNINGLLFKLATTTVTDGGTDVTGSMIYGEPSEIFLAKNTVQVVADQTNPTPYAFALTRAICVVRARLNLNANPADGTVDNSQVDFRTANKTSFRIRNHGTSMTVADAAGATAKPWGITPTTPATTNVLFSGKTFKNASEFIAANYGDNADMGLGTDFSLWNEYLAFPGGGIATDAGTQKFDVVVAGEAPVGYKAKKADGTIVSLDAKTVVYWTAQVKDGAVGANGILELNLRLTGNGIVGPVVPPVGTYGNLSISVDLQPWGTTTYTEIPMTN